MVLTKTAWSNPTVFGFMLDLDSSGPCKTTIMIYRLGKGMNKCSKQKANISIKSVSDWTSKLIFLIQNVQKVGRIIWPWKLSWRGQEGISWSYLLHVGMDLNAYSSVQSYNFCNLGYQSAPQLFAKILALKPTLQKTYKKLRAVKRKKIWIKSKINFFINTSLTYWSLVNLLKLL